MKHNLINESGNLEQKSSDVCVLTSRYFFKKKTFAFKINLLKVINFKTTKQHRKFTASFKSN